MIYSTQKKLREYKVYFEEDIEIVTSIYLDPENNKKTNSMQGKITNALLPIANRYNNDLDQQQRYIFRRDVRSFVKWYNYIGRRKHRVLLYANANSALSGGRFRAEARTHFTQKCSTFLCEP